MEPIFKKKRWNKKPKHIDSIKIPKFSPRAEAACAAFDHTFERALSYKRGSRADLSRLRQLRASQLPFCAPEYFCNVASKGMYRSLDMLGRYHTSVGTTVHEVLQDFLGETGEYLANWTCKHCKTKRVMSHENMCCDSLMQYEEITINHKLIKGHIDAVLRVTYKGKIEYWIVDFKTSKLTDLESKFEKPGVGYIEQIESYAFALRELGLNIAGWMLVFVPRDDPEQKIKVPVELGDKDYVRIEKRLKKYNKMFVAAKSAGTKKEALSLLDFGPCADIWCSVCKEPKADRTKMVMDAYRRGKAYERLPIKEFINKEQAKLDAKKRSR